MPTDEPDDRHLYAPDVVTADEAAKYLWNISDRYAVGFSCTNCHGYSNWLIRIGVRKPKSVRCPSCGCQTNEDSHVD